MINKQSDNNFIFKIFYFNINLKIKKIKNHFDRLHKYLLIIWKFFNIMFDPFNKYKN